jgi:hypothetical protein
VYVLVYTAKENLPRCRNNHLPTAAQRTASQLVNKYETKSLTTKTTLPEGGYPKNVVITAFTVALLARIVLKAVPG